MINFASYEWIVRVIYALIIKVIDSEMMMIYGRKYRNKSSSDTDI